MVKSLDDVRSVDHIGLSLWRAAQNWRDRMRREMAARGFPWHMEARGDVLAHVGPNGLAQTVLAERMGLSKQAVQQLLDQLEGEGVIQRVPDPRDKRARRVELTGLGLFDLVERNAVKREIEDEYKAILGAELFTQMERALRILNARSTASEEGS
ncbi:hypothetical protein JP74_19520 [Devosia sp. 17-2-E-8]|nr:hypothetical protein JP74_19520 [Devosia sp. 17-2-E-8]